MALTKRTYTDGQTIITAANLNSIQDEIINNTVSNLTYTASSRVLAKRNNAGASTNIVTFNNIIDLSVTEVTS